MTQDVQPLTWQKRTNIEEHMQFFSKINEIIANLAPTVDEAEQAIAQATQAIADANAAIATANAASAAADAAAQSAQAAAATVAGYDTRLTAAEGDIDELQANSQTMGFNIMNLTNRMTAAESKNTQQDTAIGALQTADGQIRNDITALQTADANNVKIAGTHAIGNYAVLLTGNQDPIAGDKTFTGRIKADFAKGRITSADTLDIVTNYDGMNIYYLYMSNVQAVPGVPTGIDDGGAILYHSRIYAYGDATNSYVFYSQMLISSTGNIYTRRHIMTTNRDTQEVTWGNEKWKLHSNTEVTPL